MRRKRKELEMRLDKLKGKLKEKGVTYQGGADALGISITSFSNKMNDKQKFTVLEAHSLSNLLEMTNEEKVSIFLD